MREGRAFYEALHCKYQGVTTNSTIDKRSGAVHYHSHHRMVALIMDYLDERNPVQEARKT